MDRKLQTSNSSTSRKFKVGRERGERLKLVTRVCFPVLTQTEVQWLEIIVMKQMPRGCCKYSDLPVAVIVSLVSEFLLYLHIVNI